MAHLPGIHRAAGTTFAAALLLGALAGCSDEDGDGSGVNEEVEKVESSVSSAVDDAESTASSVVDEAEREVDEAEKDE